MADFPSLCLCDVNLVSSRFKPVHISSFAMTRSLSFIFQTHSNTHCCLSLSAAERTGSLGCIGWLIVILSGIFAIVLFPFTVWFCVKVSEMSGLKRQTAASVAAHLKVKWASDVVFLLFLQIVQEYERAVIFRLGRITDKRAKGPGRHNLFV